MRGIVAIDGQLRQESFEKPILSPTECLIKVHYAGINRADVLQKKGLYPPPSGVTEILGLEFSGEIVEVGAEVIGRSIGDLVCSIVAGGAYAEFVKIEEQHLISIPQNLTLEHAGGMPEAFITAYQALIKLGTLQKGETVLVHAGASGLGAAAIQLARRVGAKVIVTASAGKHSFCEKLGADRCIDYKSEDFGDVISDVDLVLDLIGGSYFHQNLKVLGLDGRMIMLGFLGGVKVENVNIASIVTKRLKIEGSTLRARNSKYKSELISDFQVQFIKGGHFPFETSIDRTFEFSEVNDAHMYMEENKNKGKILLKIL